MRTTPMPARIRVLIDGWAQLVGLADGRVFRALRPGDHLADSRGMSPDAIADVVRCGGARVTIDRVTFPDSRLTLVALAMVVPWYRHLR